MDSLEVLAAKWRVDPRSADDAPTREPMRQAVSPIQRRNPTPQQIRERRRIQRGEVKTAAYTLDDFRNTVVAEYDRVWELNDPNANHAKSWNIADQSDRGDGSGSAGGTPVSQSMSDSSVGSTNSGGSVGGSGAGSGSTAARRDPGPVQEGMVGDCDDCGQEHEATYHHEGQFGDGPIYAVTCLEDGLTQWHTNEGIHERSTPLPSPIDFARHATRGETNIATSTGQILLNPGSMIRMPTGQVLNVKNVRRHESSPDHYYLDTDAGTSVVPWSTNFTMVTRDDQQKNLPNTGMPGGNFGDQSQNKGRIDQSFNRHPGDRDSLEGDAQPNRCGGCGSNGTLTLRGGKMQCSKCGHTQSTGTGGLSFSDATQQYLSSLIDPRSAIQRRVAAVLAQPAEPNQEESL